MINDLPKDPMLCLSVVNTRLRDAYPSLEELCKALGIEPLDLIDKLKSIDYEYDSKKNQFI